MYCVVGLGNIGESYSKTRHNAGFMAIDCLAEKLGLDLTIYDCAGELCSTVICGQEVILCKPQTSLNKSGECVKQLLEKFALPVENIIILYDDSALPVGEIRIRSSGSGGYHNGMRSIISCLEGNENFPRIRIGIGRPASEETLVSHVLGTPDREEELALGKAYANAADAVLLLITENIDSAQRKYNIKGKTRRNGKKDA